MELSWRVKYDSRCKLRMRSTTRCVLMCLGILTLLVLFIQMVYLHSMKNLSPESHSSSCHIYGRSFKQGVHSFVTESKQKTILHCQCFGKGTCIARFVPLVVNATEDLPFNIIEETIEQTVNRKYSLFRHPRNLSSTFNGNISRHRINRGVFNVAVNNNIFILSSISRNLIPLDSDGSQFHPSNMTTGKRLIVQVGWINKSLAKNVLRCCLLLGNNSIVSYINEKRMIFTQVQRQPLLATKLFCPVPKELSGVHVRGSTMSLLEENCVDKKFMAVEYIRERPAHSFAVCAKIAYGTVSAQRLIEWMEIQKRMGVDKVLIYFYNLNKEAMRVLLNYQREGFVDLLPFDYPLAERMKRFAGQKTAQAFIDEQVLLYDAMERLRAYTYVAVIDVDEIIFPRTSPDRNIKHLMIQLVQMYPNAAGFSFRTELFLTDWENKEDLGPEMNKFWHARYLNRTRPLEDRVKNVVIIDRVILGTIWTHNYTALPQYIKYKMPVSIATLKHYRRSRENWHHSIGSGYRDLSIAKLFHSENVINNTLEKFQTLLDIQTQHAINNYTHISTAT